LRRGNFVIFLARGKKSVSAQKRVDEVVNFIDNNVFKRKNSFYRVIESDITKPDLNLSFEDFEYLRKIRPDGIFHSAASVEFAEEKRELTRTINCQGTKNILKLASKIGSPHFHHISSLYVAGKREGKILESELIKGQKFNNVYEETKAESELIVRDWAIKKEKLFNIYRLPIVIGDSITGKATSYTGFYGFFKPFWGIKKSIEEKIPNKKLEDAAIYAKNGHVFAPLFIKCFKKSRIDLVPVDWIVEKICQLQEEENFLPNATFHFSHPSPPSSEEVIKKALPIIGLKGFRFVVNGDSNAKHQNPTLKAYQRVIDRMTGQYFEYNSNKKSFDNFNLKITLKDYFPPPKISKKLLKKELENALKNKFKPFC
jgi:nucleoside-diphosphate-sugar epimerase